MALVYKKLTNLERMALKDLGWALMAPGLETLERPDLLAAKPEAEGPENPPLEKAEDILQR